MNCDVREFSVMDNGVETLVNQKKIILRKSHEQLLEEIDGLCKKLIEMYLHGDGAQPDEVLGVSTAGYESRLESIREKVFELQTRLDASLEIESLLNGMDGGYIEAGPSGLITRGRDDVLPTGRNFYSLDHYRVPTKTAWKVGCKLGGAVIAKHQKEEGRYPENNALPAGRAGPAQDRSDRSGLRHHQGQLSQLHRYHRRRSGGIGKKASILDFVKLCIMPLRARQGFA
jgi:cobalamin biosynthesis Mg chelatase CobN